MTNAKKRNKKKKRKLNKRAAEGTTPFTYKLREDPKPEEEEVVCLPANSQ